MQIVDLLNIHMKCDNNICDPTWVKNEADVVREPNCDFAVNIFYMNQESFWHINNFDTFFHSKDMRKTKSTC